MSSTFGSEIDVQFYELIHSLQTNQPIRHSDRRRSPRHFVGKHCLIAPYKSDSGEPIPPSSEFEEVVCYDLTRHGFSFFADKEPSYSQVAVELGSGDRRALIEATVRRCEQVVVLPTGGIAYVGGNDSVVNMEGDLQYLIGCQFIHRLNLEDQSKSSSTDEAADA